MIIPGIIQAENPWQGSQYSAGFAHLENGAVGIVNVQQEGSLDQGGTGPLYRITPTSSASRSRLLKILRTCCWTRST